MKLSLKDVVVFGMFGALIYATEVVMRFLPNIHLTAVFTVILTLVYRKKALYPIYIYVLINGVFSGFATWWIPYLYIWAVLWAMTMIIPKNIPEKVQPLIYMVVCGLHGILFGILYAPAQALLFGMDFKTTLIWIAHGIPFDMVHCVSNFCCGILIAPVVKILKKIA